VKMKPDDGKIYFHHGNFNFPESSKTFGKLSLRTMNP
jgi:hypothetical protein